MEAALYASDKIQSVHPRPADDVSKAEIQEKEEYSSPMEMKKCHLSAPLSPDAIHAVDKLNWQEGQGGRDGGQEGKDALLQAHPFLQAENHATKQELRAEFHDMDEEEWANEMKELLSWMKEQMSEVKKMQAHFTNELSDLKNGVSDLKKQVSNHQLNQ